MRLSRLGFGLKKTLRAAERDRPDVIAKEEAFIKEVSEIPVENLVFLDEAGVHLGMTRSHARAPIGERAMCKRSAAYKSNISLAGAIQLSGMCELYPYDGPMDGERFQLFLDRLVPKLKPNSVLIMDNLRVHHMAAVKSKLKDAGIRVLYLPPYSPERNPIEETWSLIKRAFRTAEADTISKFIDALQNVKNIVTQHKIEAFFKHAGYILAE